MNEKNENGNRFSYYKRLYGGDTTRNSQQCSLMLNQHSAKYSGDHIASVKVSAAKHSAEFGQAGSMGAASSSIWL